MENWHQQCQVILRASCGMSYAEFIEFLDVIAKERMCTFTEKAVGTGSVENNSTQKSSLKRTEFESSVFQDWKKTIGILETQEQRTVKDYCRYDLMKIKECLITLKDNQSFRDLQSEDLHCKVTELLHDINTTMNNKQT